MADQSAVVNELMRRRDSLPPEKQAVVDELAKRFNAPAEQPAPAAEEPERPGFFNRLYQSTVEPIVDAVSQVAKRGAPAVAHEIIGGVAERYKANPDPNPYYRAASAVISPMIQPIAEDIQDRNLPGAAGSAIGAVLTLLGPKTLKGKSVRLSPRAKSLGPVQQEAVNFGVGEGIPIDAATATDSNFIKNVQTRAGQTMLGSSVVAKTKAAQAEALTQTGARIAERAGPQAATAETSGAGVRTSIEGRIGKLHDEAGQHYQRLRKIEADPQFQKEVQVGSREVDTGILDEAGKPIRRAEAITKKVSLPVDMKPVKQSLEPIYERLKETMPLTQQQASPGLKAIENILSGDDIVSASTADANLSAIKSIARQAESPDLRSVSQGLAARAVKDLDTAVTEAVKAGGPKASNALSLGRAMTRGKYKAADTLSRIPQESVQVFERLTAKKDSQIGLLRDVATQAPEAIPQIGRALVEGMLETATAEGGFSRTQGLLTKWRSIGPETKKALFQDAKLVRDLDNFWTLADRIAKDPNPSGTAKVLTSGGEAGAVFTLAASGNVVGAAAVPLTGYVVAKLLTTPRGVKWLKTGLRIPADSASGAATAARITALIGKER